ncbi:MAG: NADH-quinone oxidoreductase subunit NuoH [Alphaproteobacteria bacterium GM202ARS2]|nr:NADH-quinone oxidoreductase subunit NuoH [Alphaproteobacteria bacterium GM202ARS2]
MTILYEWLLLVAVTLGGMIALLISVALLTWYERKVMAAMQLRRGPNVVGPFGLLQPVADGIKMITKETIVPTTSHRGLFILAPLLTFALALMAWAVIPFGDGLVLADIHVGVLYVLAISSLGVYGVIIAGWASQSRYALLGALRSAAQMISYEVAIGFVLVSVLLLGKSLNLSQLVAAQQDLWFCVPLFPMMVVFFISSLAETNRAPFDLPEAEAELVAGYHVEYSGMTFGLFFMGEYANMILMSALLVLLFFGGWLPPLAIAPFTWVPEPIWLIGKIVLVLFVFLWVRASFPRYRYDQLMRLGWKVFLPLSLVWLILVAAWVTFGEHRGVV